MRRRGFVGTRLERLNGTAAGDDILVVLQSMLLQTSNWLLNHLDISHQCLLNEFFTWDQQAAQAEPWTLLCIAIRSDVSGLDGAAEARVGSILQMLDVSGLDGASEHA